MASDEGIFKKMKIIFPRNRATRMFFFLLADFVFVALSVYIAFFLRLESKIPASYYPMIFKIIGISLFFYVLSFSYYRLYSFSWSYVSVFELVSLFKASLIGFLLVAGSLYILKDSRLLVGLPRSTLFISLFLILLFCGGIRLSKRIYLEFLKKSGQAGKERTLIVGAGDAGVQILNSISAKNNPYHIIGFIDDSPIKKGVSIQGFKVFGGIDEMPKIIKRHFIEGIIIALPSVSSSEIKKAAKIGREGGIKKIKIAPSVAEIIGGKISARDLREIQVEDLLGRQPIFLDVKSIEDSIKGKKILITGAAGSIGSELSRQVSKFNPSLVVLLDQDETGVFNISKEISEKFPALKTEGVIADIKDKIRIKKIFYDFNPEIVFHAAAYKHVSLMEKYPEEAVKNNILGTKNIAMAAIESGAEKFIFISTDKAVNPCSIMGASKRVGEMICQSLNQDNKTKFISVRFGNVLDSRGSVVPIFRQQIQKGGPVEVTHPEMKRYFMVTPEAVLLVLQSSVIGRGGEVLVLDMGQPIKILDLAREMIKLSGLEPDKDIPIVFTSPRPGEKLFEEILTAEEGTIATQNQKIFIANLESVDKRRFENNLVKLKEAAANQDSQKIKNILQLIIPTYKTLNK